MIVARAPLRVPLGGGGTDFPSYYLQHGGYILGFALNKYVHVVMHDTIDKKIRLKYSKAEEVTHVDDLENRVAAEALKWYGVTGGIEVATFSDVPECSGLGGSSAFCVALVTALRYKLGMNMEKEEIMASAFDIERNKAEQPGGMQDQFFAAFGGAWRLELKTPDFDTDRVDVSGLLPHLKLLYTGSGRTSSVIARSQEIDMDTEQQATLDNLHRTKALGRQIGAHLDNQEYEQIGRAFGTHWETKRQRHPDISSPDIDKIYEEAMAKGAVGGKLMGVGGGGYLLLYVANGNAPREWLDIGLDEEGAKICYGGIDG